MNRWLIAALIFIAGACTNMERKKQKAIDVYYDINGLIEAQVILLDSISPVLYKSAILDHNQEYDTLKPTLDQWENELSIFKSMDINKPMLADSYTKKLNSNGTEEVTTWISKSPKKTEVDTLKIYQSAENLPIRIIASISSKNTLFHTSKKLELAFRDYNGNPLLEQFSIKGWQKMLSKDSTTFDISARIKP